MATFIAHGKWNLSDWDLTSLAGATLANPSATGFALVAADGTTTTFAGAGFSGFGASGLPTRGTIDHLAVASAAGSFSISDIALPLHLLNAIAADNDFARLQHVLFAGDDRFVLSHGGHNTVAGFAGDDTFVFGGHFDPGDSVNGGGGYDTVKLDGDYSAGVVMGPASLLHVEQMNLARGHSYTLMFDNATLDARHPFVVDATSLRAGDALILDDTAERNGSMTVRGGHGDDTIRTGTGDDVTYGGARHDVVAGGRGNDAIDGGSGRDVLRGNNGDDTVSGGADNDRLVAGKGADAIYGGAGDDDIFMQGRLSSGDHIDGGAGFDTVHLRGAELDTIDVAALGFENVEDVVLGPGDSYRLNFSNAFTGNQMTIDGSALGAGDTVNAVGSAALTTAFTMVGGAGADTLTGGNLADTLQGGLGSDVLDGGAGADVFKFLSAADSTGDAVDTIVGFDPTQDVLDVAGSVTNIDSPITGLLSSLDGLTSLAGLANLGAGDAVLVQPLLGALAGQTLMVIDQNGVLGFQPGTDMVLNLVNALNLDDLGIGSFI